MVLAGESTAKSNHGWNMTDSQVKWQADMLQVYEYYERNLPPLRCSEGNWTNLDTLQDSVIQ
ncbi:hypothetical protein AJ80_06519 [Polytolypa hystricis UAMH7299]|uniref:Uncharacterized protein n=1 Tax=Polytolypa hystricis (strain UAMH7299) TaxID=1447883 RepID=A0A2B7XMB7_POLH7|nr:hypothetical protein AJ80_06519 [Polytolypa hystricis UAMH7299]